MKVLNDTKQYSGLLLQFSLVNWTRVFNSESVIFFIPNPRAYLKFRRLGGVAMIIFLKLPGDAKSRQLSCRLHFLPTTLYPREKTIWTLLGLNPGRLRGKRPRYPLLHASRAPEVEVIMFEFSFFKPSAALH